VANAAELRAFTFIQEFADARDADDARHYCNGKDFDGNRLIVEFARRVSVMVDIAVQAVWCSVSPVLKFHGFGF